MHKFYDNLPLEAAEHIEQLSRLMYELRENRARLLEQYGSRDEDGLLDLIRAGRLEEHPAYEHYLSARVLAETRDAIRAELADLLKEVKPE
ncbi:MAG: hypothetical protein AB1768_09315 [Pseudomonadota bacterium]|jgi:hypothetical protein